MGPNPSIHKLPADLKSLDLADKNLSIIPIRFPKKSKLKELILSQNQIRELPKGLKHLKTIIMTQNGLEEFSQPMIDCLLTCRAIKKLDFSFNLLTSFPTEWARLENLRTICLFGNRLETFPALKHKVKLLDLGSNCLTQIPELPEQISALNVDGNRIEVLNVSHSKLSRLTISMNLLKSVSPEARFEELLVIDISRNNLTELPNLENLFPKLQQFDASHNMIEECPKFPKSTSEIFFADNRLKSLPPNFASLILLCHADFSGNQIEEVPLLPPVLQSLFLFDNKIKKIEKGQPKLQNLSGLYLNDNELTEIPRFGTAEIANLWLMSNKLTGLRIQTLSDKIVSINVSDNEITELPAALFELPHLMYIYAARNKIKTLPNVVRGEVILMNLSGNPLEEFPDSLPPLLESLYIAGCGLKELPKCVLEAKELINLHAARNELTDFPYIPGLVKLSLSGNQLVKFPRLAPTITRVDLSWNQITKMLRKRRFPELRYLDISHNPLKKISGSMIAPKLRIFKIGCCRAKQELDCSAFPSLTFVDLTKTRVQAVNPNSELKLIMASGSKQSGELWHRVSLNQGTTYTGTLGADNLMEDVVLLRHKQGAFYYGIFDSRSGGETSLSMSALVHGALNAESDVTEDGFGELAKKLVETYKEKQLLDGSGFVLARQFERKVIVSSVGSFEAFFVNKSLDKLTFLTDKEKESRLHFPNILGNEALDARMLGSTLVYNMDIPCKVETSVVDDHEKYLVLASPTVLMALNEPQMLQLCQKCKDGRELAYSIRNRTYSAIDTDNVTVIVVDVESERQELYSPEKSDAPEPAHEESESKSKEEESQGEEIPPDVPEREDEHCLSCSAKSADNTDCEYVDDAIPHMPSQPVKKGTSDSEDSDLEFLTAVPKPPVVTKRESSTSTESTNESSSAATTESNSSSDTNTSDDDTEAGSESSENSSSDNDSSDASSSDENSDSASSDGASSDNEKSSESNGEKNSN